MENVVTGNSRGLSFGKRFWYGLGGFVGSNLILNLTMVVFEMVFFSNPSWNSDAAWVVLLLYVAVVQWPLRVFYRTRVWDSTRTGIKVSVIIASLWFFAGIVIGLQGL